MFSFLKRSRAKPIGDLYVHEIVGANPELFLDLDQTALPGLGKEKYVTMRVIVVKPDDSQK